jgi:hypothetical protein
LEHKFNVGDTVTILRPGWGFHPRDTNELFTITGLGMYGGGPGYHGRLHGTEYTSGLNGYVGEKSFLFK